MKSCAVVGLPREIDFGNADSVSNALLALLNQGVAHVVADMTATRYCDAAGIRAVVRASARAEEMGCWVRVVIPRPNVRKVFALTGADSLVGIYISLNHALTRHPKDALAQVDQPVPVALLVPGQPSYPDLAAPWEAGNSAAYPAAEPPVRAAMSAPSQRTGSPEVQPMPAHLLVRKQRSLNLVAQGRSACERSLAARSQTTAVCAHLATTWADVAATYEWLANRRPAEAARLLPARQTARAQATAYRRLANHGQA